MSAWFKIFVMRFSALVLTRNSTRLDFSLFSVLSAFNMSLLEDNPLAVI